MQKLPRTPKSSTKSMKNKIKFNIQKILVNVCRFLLAFTFIFSGFVKANDPFGMVYKLNDYFASMGRIEIPELITLLIAIGLAFVEFTLGINLFFGISRKKTSTFTLLFMSLMTLLTIYIFIFNPVSDCGCFGDVIILSNGATLTKNIILLAAAIALKRYSKLQAEFLPDKFKWLVSMLNMASILAFAFRCVICLPLIDFRPYKIGTDLRSNYNSYHDSSNFDVKIIYEKNGEVMELGIDDDDPDSTWTYVETRRDIKNKKQLETSDFYFVDAETEDEITEEILYNEGTTLLLIIPDLTHSDESCADKINDLYEHAQDKGYAFYCITGSVEKTDHKYWTDHTGAEYPYSIGDERLLKTIVRANPGLVLMQDGVIVDKWSNYNFPTAEDFDKYVK